MHQIPTHHWFHPNQNQKVNQYTQITPICTYIAGKRNPIQLFPLSPNLNSPMNSPQVWLCQTCNLCHAPCDVMWCRDPQNCARINDRCNANAKLR